MFLVNTTTLRLEEFNGSDIPPYGILSHRWEKRGEINFQQFKNQLDTHLQGWEKIKKCCKIALGHNQRYVWIDTCCIDKTSSACLSEAINSMWNYYENAEVCLVYMNDVNERAETIQERYSSFRVSRWFTRGWTLQELLAPMDLRFFNKSWSLIGNQISLLEAIASATGIRKPDLFNPRGASIATRMSWMSERKTSREEDVAYCLLGLFNVNMPLLYGEGSLKAFRRLLVEIINDSDDETVFTFSNYLPIVRKSSPTLSEFERSLFFGMEHAPRNYDLEDIRMDCQTSLLASKPSDFSNYADVQRKYFSHRAPYKMTNKGLSIEVQFADHVWFEGYRCWPIPLNCSFRGSEKQIFIYLTKLGVAGLHQGHFIPDPNVYCKIDGHSVDFNSRENGYTRNIFVGAPREQEHDDYNLKIHTRARNWMPKDSGLIPDKENLVNLNYDLYTPITETVLRRRRQFKWPIMDVALICHLKSRARLISFDSRVDEKIYQTLKSINIELEYRWRPSLAADSYVTSMLQGPWGIGAVGELLYVLYYRARIQYTALLTLMDLFAAADLRLNCLEVDVDLNHMSDNASIISIYLRQFSGMKLEEDMWSISGIRIAGCIQECSDMVREWLAVIIVGGTMNDGRPIDTIVASRLFGHPPDHKPDLSLTFHASSRDKSDSGRYPALFWGWFLPPFLSRKSQSQNMSDIKANQLHVQGSETTREPMAFEEFFHILAPSFERFLEIEQMWAQYYNIRIEYDTRYEIPKHKDDVQLFLRNIYDSYTRIIEQRSVGLDY